MTREEREQALEWFKNRPVTMSGAKKMYDLAIEALSQPEIVRCKDCKHYKEWESEFTPNAVVTQCMADNFPIRKAIPDGWFCAGAERRTDEA